MGFGFPLIPEWIQCSLGILPHEKFPHLHFHHGSKLGAYFCYPFLMVDFERKNHSKGSVVHNRSFFGGNASDFWRY